MKLLLGGSPCTYWSIAQTKNRETQASGMGWELFRNYVIARDKFAPDFFLYENIKSMSAAIREQITTMLGVEPICINSALVSAQNRQRLYWVGRRGEDGQYHGVDIPQPEDRGILLRDILESGYGIKEKAYTLRASADTKQGMSSLIKHIETNGQFGYQGVLEPVTAGASLSQKATDKPVYEVKDGKITIRDKQYPIKLRDGYYIIRKLTVTECKRLQTVPDEYEFPVSNSQAYKMLGNGWTVDVIAHLLSYCDGLLDEPVDVLSMYDGMGCGHIALDKLGAKINSYVATEIDKYAIKTAQHNFPDIIQLGDAFQVRGDTWGIP